MTTNDIKEAQIVLRMKDGTAYIGLTDDAITLYTIASCVKFVQIDENVLSEINIKDIAKK